MAVSTKRVVTATAIVAALVAILVLALAGSSKRHTQTSLPVTRGSATRAHVAVERMKPTATIAGTVRDPKQQGVAGARVCARGSASDLPYRVFREPRCATTDASGAYTITNLIGATYTVSAFAQGRRPARRAKILIVTGEQKGGVDFVLADGGVEVRGVVRDITGGPIAGARVLVQDGWTNADVAHAETDAAGTFKVWVTPGELWVNADADGYVGDGERMAMGRVVEIVLTPSSSISGTVVDAKSGESVSGVPLFLGEGGDSPSDISDERGRFHIDKLRPGRKRVIARGPRHFGAADGTILVGLAQDVTDVVVRVVPAVRVSAVVMLDEKPSRPCDEPRLELKRADGERLAGTGDMSGAIHVDGVLPGRYEVRGRCGHIVDMSAAVTIDVASSNVEGLRFDVKRAGILRGHVRLPNGDPVADASVRIDHYERTKSDATGAYELTGFGSFGKQDVSAVSSAGTTPPTDDYRIEVPDGTIVERDLVLAPASRVSGRVVDTNGKPVSGLGLMARKHFDENVRFSSAFFAESRDDGSYEMVGLPAATYSIHVWGEDGVNQIEPKNDKVTITAPTPVTIDFVVTASNEVITGTVIDAAKAPVSDAYIVTSFEQEGRSAVDDSRSSEYWAKVMTDEEGRFRVTGLVAGSYTVRALRKGGGEAIVEHVAAGSNVSLQIKPTGSIEGTVTSRASLDDIRLNAEQTSTGLVREERLYFSGGRYVVRDLPAGPYRIIVKIGARVAAKRVELAEGQRLTGVDLDLDAGIVVTGRVVDFVTGQPFVGLRIWARSVELERSELSNAQVTTDATGRFTFDSLLPGLVMFSGSTLNDDNLRLHVVRVLSGSKVDLGIVGMAKPAVDYDKSGELGITFKHYPGATPNDATRLEIVEVAPPAAHVVAVGDVVTTVNGIDVTGNNYSAAANLLLVAPGTAVKLGLASGKTVTVVAAKR